MAGQAGHSIPASVLRVRERFESWRRTKLGRERIPERLWTAAVRLCAQHRVHRVARWLRLNDSALRARVQSAGRGLGAKKGAAPAFVEWVSTAPLTSPPVAGAEYVLELQDGADLRIRVRGAGIHDVAALARLLREDRA